MPATGATTPFGRLDDEPRWNNSAVNRVFAVARNGLLTAPSSAAWDGVPYAPALLLSTPRFAALAPAGRTASLADMWGEGQAAWSNSI
jgi:hypothetical protein